MSLHYIMVRINFYHFVCCTFPLRMLESNVDSWNVENLEVQRAPLGQ